MAQGFKSGGRKKGTPNKSTETVHQLLDQVFAKVNPVRKLISLLNKPLDAGVEARVLLRLLEYRYGQPTENINVIGRVEHEFIEAGSLSDEQLAQADALIESACAGSDKR